MEKQEYNTNANSIKIYNLDTMDLNEYSGKSDWARIEYGRKIVEIVTNHLYHSFPEDMWREYDHDHAPWVAYICARNSFVPYDVLMLAAENIANKIIKEKLKSHEPNSGLGEAITRADLA